MGTTTYPVFPIGEDSEWMFAEGHIEPTEFIRLIAVYWPQFMMDPDVKEPTSDRVEHVFAVEHPPNDSHDGYFEWAKWTTAETPGAKPFTVIEIRLSS